MTEIKKIDWSDVIQDVVKDVLESVKGQAVTFIKEEVIPNAKIQKELFIEKLKVEMVNANVSTKLKNGAIILGVTVAGKLFTSLIEKLDVA